MPKSVLRLVSGLRTSSSFLDLLIGGHLAHQNEFHTGCDEFWGGNKRERNKSRLFVWISNGFDKMIAICLDLKWTGFWISDPFKIWTICNPTSFGPFKIQISDVFDAIWKKCGVRSILIRDPVPLFVFTRFDKWKSTILVPNLKNWTSPEFRR